MYNKIFHKILDSSIWLEPTPTRIVWITLLAAMDEDGYAHFSALENLASRARVTIDEARSAVECFLAPDPNSANPANEGRRIERVPGGYFILNSTEHRQIVNRVIQREQTRERVAKHRANKKLSNVDGADRDKAIEQQDTCACCERPFEKPYSQFVVLDHNHKTGATRAFICQSCNKVVGQIENGKTCNSKNTEKAMIYIARFSGVTELLRVVTPRPYTEADTEAVSETEKKTLMSGKPDDDPRNCKQQAREILSFLNEKTGRVYKATDANLGLIVCRLKEGYTLREMFQVIAKKCSEWGPDEKMNIYLRPKTLFNRTNFSNYAGELVAPKEIT